MPKDYKDKSTLSYLQKKVKKKLDKDRYQHTLGVTYTAAALAMVHNYNLKDAQTAGILHDCAKNMSDNQLLKICQQNKIEISAYEKSHLHMLHAKVGALLAKSKYKIKSAEIRNSILWHTTGKPAMNKLEKIIYIADYIEPGRDRAPNLERIRKIAFRNLDECVYLILKDSLEYLRSSSKEIDRISESAFEYYSNLHNQA